VHNAGALTLRASGAPESRKVRACVMQLQIVNFELFEWCA
jgi:hypothetical protein